MRLWFVHGNTLTVCLISTYNSLLIGPVFIALFVSIPERL